MKNTPLIQTLDDLANYYTLLNDHARVRTFRAAARNLELITFEITSSNLKDVNFKGLGKSLREIIEEFVTTGAVKRLQELQLQLPPLQALDLLQLFNFDLQFVLHLWNKHKAHTLEHLYSLRSVEPRVNTAIDALSRLNLTYTQLPTATYPLLGDMVVQSAFGAGSQTIDQICTTLKERDYKHGFVADFCESPNVLHGLSKEKILSQREVIKQAQIKHNIRIWQGLIVDVDLDGNVPTEHAALVDYVIIKCSTHPHENIIKRCTAALTKLPGAFLDILDKYCTLLDKQQFLQLAMQSALILHTPDFITTSRILDFIDNMPLINVGLASYATNDQQLDNIFLAQDLAQRLLYSDQTLVNCRPHPFKAHVKYTSTTGVREANNPSKTDALQRLEATLHRIQQLQNTGLKHLFKDKK